MSAESTNVDDQDLKILISTPQLLSYTLKSSMVQTDGTFKMNWQGYPVILIGTSDKNNKFHPFALAVLKGETTDDYAFVFRSMKLHVSDWSPKMLLADGSDAITAAFEQECGIPDVRIMCFYHVLHNCEKYLKPLQKCGKSDALKADITTLQHCRNQESFSKASQLFLRKWKKDKDLRVKEFVSYFQEQWLVKYPNWYEGAAPGYLSTNNGIEGTNAWLKRSHTLRELSSVGQFLSGVETLRRNWFQRRDPVSVNCEIFAESPTLTTKI